MTFSLPEQLAVQFLRRVPSRERSRFVSDALLAQLQARDLQLIQACEAANKALESPGIERESDAIGEPMAGRGSSSGAG